MPSLPMGAHSFRPLYEMMVGQIRGRLLQAGMSLGVFDLLGDYRTADEAASVMGAHPGNLALFLDGLANIGLVEKKDGRYRNSPLAAEFLAPGSSLYIGPLLNMARKMSLEPLAGLEELVRNGPRPIGGTEDASERPWVESARASAPWAMGEMGCRAARIVSGLPGFERFEKMLDLGGGHGLFALYIAQAGPNLHAVVFDHEPVAEVASEFISAHGMGHKVTVMTGDYVTGDIGRGYDLIWASATLGPSKDHLEEILQKIRGALKPGGYFVSLHDGMTCEQTQPGMILEWLGGLLASGADMRFEQGELAGALLRCGFSSVRSKTLETPLGDMDLDVARK